MHYEITVQPVRRADAEEASDENISNVNRAASDVLRIMRERADVVLTATERTGAVAVATGLLERRMKHVSSETEQENAASGETSGATTEAAPAGIEAAEKEDPK